MCAVFSQVPLLHPSLSMHLSVWALPGACVACPRVCFGVSVLAGEFACAPVFTGCVLEHKWSPGLFVSTGVPLSARVHGGVPEFLPVSAAVCLSVQVGSVRTHVLWALPVGEPSLAYVSVSSLRNGCTLPSVCSREPVGGVCVRAPCCVHVSV